MNQIQIDLIFLALEEYENLKRIPDPRQLAYQRYQQQQQQQHLNALIARQQEIANANRLNSSTTGQTVWSNIPSMNPDYLSFVQMICDQAQYAAKHPARKS